MPIQFFSQSLKEELTQLLGHYNVPMDDRSLILEKIEDSINQNAQTLDNAVRAERIMVDRKFEDFQRQALSTVQGVIVQAKNATKKAYKMGLEQGIDQAKPSGPSWFQIGIMAGLLLLAGVVVYREFFPKSRKTED